MADSRDMLRAWLSLEGYRVEVAANGVEALKLLAIGSFAAVLTDMWMPEMTGAELVAAIRSQPALQELPVVLMSAAFSDALTQVPGADAFLRKPLDFSALLAILARLDRSARPQAEAA